MELSTALARKRVGESFSFELTEKIEPQSFSGRRVEFEAPLHVVGRYVFDGKAFDLEAEVDTVLRSDCARCLKPFSEPFAFSVEERFVKGGEIGEDDDLYPYEGDTLDITKAVYDNLFLQLPIVSVCSPDCKGLCPICGCDRNVTECSCQPTDAGNPFVVLKMEQEKDQE